MSYAEIPNAPEFSVSATGLTIAVWMRPDALTFPKTEGSLPTEQYVHWLGKGEAQRQEWTFRMYSQTTPPGLRANRISFYVFNPEGARGCGSYFQDPVVAGQWIHVVGVVDAAAQQTAIYKNGEFRHSDSYGNQITPAPGRLPCGWLRRIWQASLKARLDRSTSGAARLRLARSKNSMRRTWSPGRDWWPNIG